MIEITNNNIGPISLIVKSRRKLNSFTTLTVNGRGSGKNVILLEDEIATEYINRLADKGLIKMKTINQ